MKRQHKRLRINNDTIRALAVDQMATAVGGWSRKTVCELSCWGSCTSCPAECQSGMP